MSNTHVHLNQGIYVRALKVLQLNGVYCVHKFNLVYICPRTFNWQLYVDTWYKVYICINLMIGNLNWAYECWWRCIYTPILKGIFGAHPCSVSKTLHSRGERPVALSVCPRFCLPHVCPMPCPKYKIACLLMSSRKTFHYLDSRRTWFHRKLSLPPLSDVIAIECFLFFLQFLKCRSSQTLVYWFGV